MGFRREMRSDTCYYVYTILNRGTNTLTAVQVGYDVDFERCQLTSAPPHAPPDTAYSPPGWACAPLQTTHDSTTFTLGWRLAPMFIGTAGIGPKSMMTGFSVALPRPDSLYEGCDWLIRFARFPRAAYTGPVRPERELDVFSDETGSISGRIIDEGGAGIPGANVYVWRSDLRARTGSDGRYTIAKVPVGGRSVLARGAGFDPCNRAHIRVAANATTRVDFRLASVGPSTPCVPYVTALDRIDVPFPGDAVDTARAVFLDPTTPMPSKAQGDRYGSRPFIYYFTGKQISMTFRGAGSDTARRAYTAAVNRAYSSPEEERLLRTAEETYPPAEAIRAVAESGPGKHLAPGGKRLWWYDDFDGVRLPYAVTMDAVRYYLGLIQAFGTGDSAKTHNIRMKAASFTYHANISSRIPTYSRDGRVFKDVYVVEMGFKWSNYCGSLCACSFDLDRTVILRRDGTALCVFGDRRPRVIVS
ncbi:MAG TPA: carboxypeptidase-like regulatory domain-containing protein [Candidatus Binatia bacterium]|nr:carboxypeptidase-like regulatory domain-containing protein [Candidatus Binatia bacterium]